MPPLIRPDQPTPAFLNAKAEVLADNLEFQCFPSTLLVDAELPDRGEQGSRTQALHPSM